jgi:hypothetical protein
MILDMEAIHENIATITPTAIRAAIICTIRYASQNLKDAEKEMSVSFNSCPSFSPIEAIILIHYVPLRFKGKSSSEATAAI